MVALRVLFELSHGDAIDHDHRDHQRDAQRH
jgi:hypothetical protein